ncbi:hypothetical protein CLU79DRAFT_32034 [Phycomyces nitens]|nr:hypothetical protein CLU79DRAFT_32034 [Phycomyces nitens]
MLVAFGLGLSLGSLLENFNLLLQFNLGFGNDNLGLSLCLLRVVTDESRQLGGQVAVPVLNGLRSFLGGIDNSGLNSLDCELLLLSALDYNRLTLINITNRIKYSKYLPSFWTLSVTVVKVVSISCLVFSETLVNFSWRAEVSVVSVMTFLTWVN